MEIGHKLSFGKFDWRVIDVQNDMVLIITENIIETKNINIGSKVMMKTTLNVQQFLMAI